MASHRNTLVVCIYAPTHVLPPPLHHSPEDVDMRRIGTIATQVQEATFIRVYLRVCMLSLYTFQFVEIHY